MKILTHYTDVRGVDLWPSEGTANAVVISYKSERGSFGNTVGYIVFEGRMWDLIVSVPNHCLPFYSTS